MNATLELITTTLDPGTFVRWDGAPIQVDADEAYAGSLARAAERSGLDESVVSGEGLLQGRRVAIMACDFSFLAGSIGVAAAERLVSAVERATAEGLPLLAATASGGTRMQEGTTAFLQMVKISAALNDHKAAGLPYLVYLRHPTTGGVLASWGGLGHVTVAQPGALVGFLGPKVYEALHGEPFPDGVQTSENLFAHGLIDGVVPPEGLRDLAAAALTVLLAPRRGFPVPEVPPRDDLPDIPAWESIQLSRRPERPSVRRLLRMAAENVVPLSGTGDGEVDPGVILCLATFGGAPCVLLGQDRRGQTDEQPMGPGALREARRGMRLAAELDLPLVTVIDTPGAALSQDAEERGMAMEIARCLADLSSLPAPTISVLLGQGTGGGALALIPADRVIAAQHGWLSPLPPEGASVILHGNTSHAPELAAAQQVRSLDLLRQGVVDHVVPELPDAAEEPEQFCLRMGAVLRATLFEVLAQDPEQRFADRRTRYRRLGLPTGR
ncbi:carboxyl transferase domain-containing protein [Ornithinicoccus hortensis]|uniref:Acetyl-CoA carboxylase carboxyl transferase subunit beta n=1 Tax=Ornithinicoccus hortensis TaxID=82346 RepID=A0A542YVK2_9MICO|nr:carboxyl transferase domain-containing protein [Ornithinicoccus hortensis]TQL52004.1 acetyl-CoA carboxylase carboxyl transferase subunit beta [Ornithinicoccus hortensis]